jgi:hemerythrin-like domain-containing protein
LALQLDTKPDCVFGDPIGALKNCHRRMERYLHILWVVADRAAGRELTGAEINAVLPALEFFRVEGPRHIADEEESLFRWLRARAITGDSEELGLLESNSRQAGILHATVNSLYSVWTSAGELSPEDELRLQSGTEMLKRLFEEHIRLEERIVFPRAAQMLDVSDFAAIGQEFRARRR